MTDTIKPGYLRVTDVIYPFSGLEYVPQDRVKAAGERGTLIHKYIESALNGFKWQVLPELVEPYYNSWKAWAGMDDQDPWILSGKLTIERRLYCDKHKITGQIDLIREMDDGSVYCYDWKTSYKSSVTWGLQAAAYAYLLSVNGFQGCSFKFIHLRNVKPVSEVVFLDVEENTDIFFKCLELYKFFEMDKTRNKNGRRV